ncbi:uncharacterized protein CTRU02_215517 [Colletotrichum truncatum]|uniref:Uncharacterized protein n=1 Tax=Colletotrichum truncatum TaxID=5467 RepID=A0ACC3YCN4_COLTU|nr:uncharacterized protein CTRU02_05538 [Colletotrichum truncatum]KAF6793981.1 hypothetical protein CTRU02_05538 [Colletotrichum truncatum]
MWPFVHSVMLSLLLHVPAHCNIRSSSGQVAHPKPVAGLEHMQNGPGNGKLTP